MSTETTNKKIKIDNGTTFGRTYTDKAIDAKLPTDLIASANKLSLGVGSTALGNGVNLDGFTYDEATKTLKASGGGELTGEALINATKDSTTITRTLDTDGKVKFDANGTLALQIINPNRGNIIVPSGTYKAGDNKVLFSPFYSMEGYEGETIMIRPSFRAHAKDGALVLFDMQEIDNDRFRLWYTLVFTKDTTLSTSINLYATLYRYYIPRR